MAMVGQPPQALQGSSEQMVLDVVASPSSSQQQQKVNMEPSSPSAIVYPAPLAKHTQVVADRDLFYDTLNKFHAALGTRLMIPTIGGKELDLHVFYIEVSARGGFEQVVKDRKWKEITVAFDFPPTTTSASYVLRKYYVMLLHHYEQVYYFGSKGQLVPPAVPFAGSSPGPTLGVNGVAKTGLQEGEKKRKKGALDLTRVHGVDLGASLGHTVSGLIDGKFEHGYLVSVTVGSDLLRGVLYHMPAGSLPQQFASVPSMVNGVGLETAAHDIRRRRRRRRKDEMPKKDPNAPKPNRSGYNFFFQEHHVRLRALHPEKDREISRLIGESWNKLTEEERAVYQEQGIKDKERYKKEMEDYRKRIKSQAYSEGSEIVRVDGANLVLDTLENTNGKHEHDLAEANSCTVMAEKVDVKSDADDPGLSSEAEKQVMSGPAYNQGATNG